MHQRDGRTNGRTDTGPQQRPHLCIASRGKNQLPLANRATHLCKCNGVAVCLKHPFSICYHAEFGCSRSNHVRISRGEPAKLASVIGPRRLGMEGVADHLKTSPSPCVSTPNLVVLLYSVVIDRKSGKLGSAGAPPVWDWTVIDLLKTSPLPICVAASK